MLHFERVQDELLDFNYDDALADIINELVAADWLSDFSPVDEPVDGDDRATVGSRLDELEEDIGDVEDLLEALG